MAGTFSCLVYHIIFSTKHRAPIITPELRPRLYEYIGGIVREQNAVLYDIGGMPDHVHLLCRTRTEPSIGDLLEKVKGGSSQWVHETFPEEHKHFRWQEGYGIFSVSKSQEATVKAYIGRQEEHHRKMSFKEEFLAFLEKHEVDYDPRYIWD